MNRAHRPTEKHAHMRYRKLAYALPKAAVWYGATVPISIATITAVGGGDIMKIDCHKKSNSTAERGRL